jgi:large subunit ribosomal protein L4e
MAKNKRQPYAVKYDAGMEHSAESWGTGRAVSRIPRVSGGGTSRAGQAAFGNMCRKGRMFAPTVTWRKWHVKINLNQRRYALTSALAATAVPALVMARGHRISNVPEIPLVLSNGVQDLNKTKSAVALLKQVGAYEDVERVKASKKVHAGKGKLRNRRYTMRRGPLVIYESGTIAQAFRNIPGVELAQVDRLNLLDLAPGGHLGRFVIWTQAAFEKLDALYGTATEKSSLKKGYSMPRSMLTIADISRVINSDEIQSVVRPARSGTARAVRKRNPLKNFGALVKLNPYASVLRRAEIKRQNAKDAKKNAKRTNAQKNAGRAFYNKLISE